jgi:hypothetical protein
MLAMISGGPRRKDPPTRAPRGAVYPTVSCWLLLLLSRLLSVAVNPQIPGSGAVGEPGAVTSLPEPSLPRGRHRRGDREPATAAGEDAFVLLRRHAGDHDRLAGAAHPGCLMAGAREPDRLRQVLAAAVAARRNASHAVRRADTPQLGT